MSRIYAVVFTGTVTAAGGDVAVPKRQSNDGGTWLGVRQLPRLQSGATSKQV